MPALTVNFNELAALFANIINVRRYFVNHDRFISAVWTESVLG